VVPAPQMFAVLGAPAPAPAGAPAAVPPPPAPVVDKCKGVCDEAQKMWKEAEETKNLAIALEKNRTTDRLSAEADLLVEDVKLKVKSVAAGEQKMLDSKIKSYLQARTQAFNGAVAARHGQLVHSKATEFEELKKHQAQLMEQMTLDVVNHGYAVARDSVAREAKASGETFDQNKGVQEALKEVSNAGKAWTKAAVTSKDASKEGFKFWSESYHGLNDQWGNITGAYEFANDSANAAAGMGPDMRWADQMVRVSGDVVQASQTEAKKQAANARLGGDMAKKVSGAVKGNSGAIVTLTDMIAQSEAAANQAASAGR